MSLFAIAFALTAHFLLAPTTPRTLQAASKIIRPAYAIFPQPYTEAMAYDIVRQAQADWLATVEHDFVYAAPLGSSEAQRWQAQGCWEQTCAHVALYNFSAGGTIEAIVNLATAELLDIWTDANARPGASPHTLHPALAIAAQDKQVQQLFGDLTQTDPMMVPMNIWLMDSDCATAWCVDLTYHDPAETGKILHITVNLHSKNVERIFYTRGRVSRPHRDPTAQREAFEDGCQEQAGWRVCWEMTAHDGLNFYEATFNGRDIFTSAKIGQVEVWYPSWPGGYRDEIGHSASVPPYFGTEVEELEDGFRVSQLFTEFTRWPNCICCYRYEQIMQFYDDGAFEARFVSHGPGCDDLSIYQPMWRIDLALDGDENDTGWVWTGEQWTEATAEQEFELLQNVNADGHKFATFDTESDLHYRWGYLPNDPLGLDEAKIFFVRGNENEGELPILTGPANTYEPPRQWLDGEPFAGENITIWYVPLMKTKKGDPWWCMPDPAPDYSPCEAVLRAEPAGALPTAAEIAATQTAVAPPADATATPTPIPTMTHTPAPTATPAPVEGETAELILLNSGCTACHVIGDLGEHNKVGPNLSNIGDVASGRVGELSARDYIRRSILYPNESIAPECPNGPCLENIMPAYYGERLTANQLELLVDYLMAQTAPIPIGEATVGVGLENTAVAPRTPTPANAFTRNATGGGSLFALISLIVLPLLLIMGLFALTRRRG